MAGPIDLKSKLLLLLVVVISVFIPIQFWRGVWFGAELSDEQIREALTLAETPRRLQHALTQLEERIRSGDPSGQSWHPQIARLAEHPREEIRLQAAWVMGQDNQSPVFRAALLKLLEDPVPIVRRNAALALTRFADEAALPVLREMLRPTPVRANAAGSVQIAAAVGDHVARGDQPAGVVGAAPIEAPLAGRVIEVKVRPGQTVSVNETILLLAPPPEHVWEALRALLLIGGEEELPLVRQVLNDPRYSDLVHRQARLTMQAIRERQPGK